MNLYLPQLKSGRFFFFSNNLYKIFRTNYKLLLVTKDQTLTLAQVLSTSIIQLLVSDPSYIDQYQVDSSIVYF